MREIMIEERIKINDSTREEVSEILELYREVGDTEATSTAIVDLMSRAYAEGYSFARKESGLIDEAVEAL
jgi:Cdc6-like AAA superfamily ATPase|tara:strand:- start:583 stop:792 length:210 start_codon:yes stop_codon:yes gene_type:complete